jgi:hypothetical protein
MVYTLLREVCFDPSSCRRNSPVAVNTYRERGSKWNVPLRCETFSHRFVCWLRLFPGLKTLCSWRSSPFMACRMSMRLWFLCASWLICSACRSVLSLLSLSLFLLRKISAILLVNSSRNADSHIPCRSHAMPRICFSESDFSRPWQGRGRIAAGWRHEKACWRSASGVPGSLFSETYQSQMQVASVKQSNVCDGREEVYFGARTWVFV